VGDYLVGSALSNKMRLVGLTRTRRVERREEGVMARTAIVSKPKSERKEWQLIIL
jgi:hypothetical protein